jgi:Arc/MetJ-type ribon-helix-helix transcriptional regulator
MSVDLSPDIWNEIQRHVETGVFATPDDVLREALRCARVSRPPHTCLTEGLTPELARRQIDVGRNQSDQARIAI